MARKIDNENTELDNYGTWVKKDLQNQSDQSISGIDTDDLDISDLDFDSDDDLELDEDFLDEIDSEDFDLSEIHDLDDELISPEEESELIQMSEDNWDPDEDDSFEDSALLSEDDMNAAGDFFDDSHAPVPESVEMPSVDENVSLSLVEKQTRLLERIENELSVIKDEILDIRSQLVLPDRKTPVREESPSGEESVPETKGFFDEDDDESIVLTGDELDNIINTAEMTAEEGSNNAPATDLLNEEDPGLTILTTPEENLSADLEDLSLDDEDLSPLEEEITLDLEDHASDERLSPMEEELSVDLEDLSPDEEEISPLEDDLSLNLDDFSLEEEDISLNLDELSLEEEISPHEVDLGLDMEDLALGDMEDLSPVEEASPAENELSLNLDELSFEEEEIPAVEELSMDLEDLTPEEDQSMDLEDLSLDEDQSMDLEDLSLDEELPELEDVDIDSLVLDLSNEESSESDSVSVDDIIEDDNIETEEIAIEDFDLNIDEPVEDLSDVPFDEVEDVSLDELLGDSDFIEETADEVEPEAPFDFDLDLTEVEDDAFDEGEIVDFDDDNSDVEELEEIEDFGELHPLDEEPEQVIMDLPRVDQDVDELAVDLDNSDLPELEELEDFDLDQDEELPNITESEDEITLDISENLPETDLSELSVEDSGDFQLPGTEDIDLNSLEALAVPGSEEFSSGEIPSSPEDITEIIEEPIEIELDDLSTEIADSVSDIIDEDVIEELSEEEDVIDIDLPDEEVPLEELTTEELEDLSLEELSPEEDIPTEEILLEEEAEDLTILEEDEESTGASEPVQAVEKNETALSETPDSDMIRNLRSNTSLDKLPSDLREEIREILTYMDQLLESLPEDKIQEFARSEYFEVYKKIFEELGITN